MVAIGYLQILFMIRIAHQRGDGPDDLSAASEWVDKEIRQFKRTRGDERIYPIVVEGDHGSGASTDSCFPDSLRFRVDNDGSRYPIQ